MMNSIRSATGGSLRGRRPCPGRPARRFGSAASPGDVLAGCVGPPGPAHGAPLGPGIALLCGDLLGFRDADGAGVPARAVAAGTDQHQAEGDTQGGADRQRGRRSRPIRIRHGVCDQGGRRGRGRPRPGPRMGRDWSIGAQGLPPRGSRGRSGGSYRSQELGDIEGPRTDFKPVPIRGKGEVRIVEARVPGAIATSQPDVNHRNKMCEKCRPGSDRSVADGGRADRAQSRVRAGVEARRPRREGPGPVASSGRPGAGRRDAEPRGAGRPGRASRVVGPSKHAGRQARRGGTPGAVDPSPFAPEPTRGRGRRPSWRAALVRPASSIRPVAPTPPRLGRRPGWRPL